MLRLIFIFLLILAHSVSYGKKYTLSETPNGLCLKQWLGKDSVIDFNSHKELKKVKIIGEMAFEKNNHIKKVILPAQLKIIEKRAFNTCEKLEQVKIPPSVTYIGNRGAFSLVMGRHVNHSDTSNLPFSYLIEQNNTTYLVPGVNLRSVGTIRDAQKWPKRDGRTDPNKLDYINYNLLSPYTVQKMFKGRETLQNLRHASGELSDIYSFHSAKIRNSALVKGIRFYEIAIHKFLGNSVIKRLEGIDFRSNEEIRARLKPDTAIGSGEWVDISGLIAPKSEIDALIDGIESGKVNRLKSINAEFEKMHSNYYTYEWTWAYEKLEEFYGIRPEGMTAEDVIHIVEKWKEAVVGLDRMVYEDAKKEFSLASMTGFGADGSRLEKELDFEQVRGDFESNPFVMAVLKHIEVKTALGDELIGRMQRVSEN